MENIDANLFWGRGAESASSLSRVAIASAETTFCVEEGGRGRAQPRRGAAGVARTNRVERLAVRARRSRRGWRGRTFMSAGMLGGPEAVAVRGGRVADAGPAAVCIGPRFLKAFQEGL